MTEEARGGRRPGAGRPKSEWGQMVRRDVRLPPHMIEYCIDVGQGDFSEGVRQVVSTSIVRRNGAGVHAMINHDLQPLLLESPMHGVSDNAQSSFAFIDLFAGIGGFRRGLEALGGSCVFSSEWNKYAQFTYEQWYGEVPHGDINSISPQDIPDHDILAAGFPCQPFSIAGVSKKNSLGRAHGFDDETQGVLFFRIAEVIKVKRPRVLFLENVKNLKSHDKGRTWKVISETLEALNYWVFHQVIDAAGWVPQHRERIYIVCFDKTVFRQRPQFSFPSTPQEDRPAVRNILEPIISPKYTLTDHLWTYLQEYSAKHKARGNGFGFGLTNLDGVARTLSARYYKDGSEILIPQEGANPRRLTPLECARLMGFGDVPVVVSDTQAYKQFGNAVVPKVVEAIGREVIKALHSNYSPETEGSAIHE